MIVSGGIQADWFIAELNKHNIASQQITSQLLKFGIKEESTPFLPASIYLKLFHWAAEHTNNHSIGLHIAQNLDIRDFGVYGYILLNSDSVAELVESLQKYQPIFMTGMGYTFHQHDDSFEIRTNYPLYQDAISKQVVEFSLALFTLFLKDKLSNNPLPSRVNFSHNMTGSESQYSEVFGDNCLFNQESNSIFFDSSITNLAIPNSDLKLKQIVKDHANNLLKIKPQHQDIVSLVRIIIASKITKEDFSIESVCQELNMHSRTLLRQLKKHDTSYKVIKDEVILELAKDALLNTNLSVSELAVQLCFSESSAFIRYFKRIMNVSPTMYRRQNSYHLINKVT